MPGMKKKDGMLMQGYANGGAVKGQPFMKMANGGKAKAFKPCKGCPSPAKCKSMGKCMKAK